MAMKIKGVPLKGLTACRAILGWDENQYAYEHTGVFDGVQITQVVFSDKPELFKKDIIDLLNAPPKGKDGEPDAD